MLAQVKKMVPVSVKHKIGELKVTIPMLYRRTLFGDTSQFGEVSACRRLIRPDWPKYVVDVGAYDGFNLSNAYPFIHDGWEAVLVEPHPTNFKRLSARFAGNSKVHCVQKACSNVQGTLPLFLEKGRGMQGGASATISTDQNSFMNEIRSEDSVNVEVDLLTNILTGLGTPKDFSVLTVDAEGVDLQVLEGLDPSKFRPRLVITEEYEHEPEKHERKYALLRERGYLCHGKVGCNTIWIASELKSS